MRRRAFAVCAPGVVLHTAGGYNAEQTARYVAKIKAKINQGLGVGAG